MAMMQFRFPARVKKGLTILVLSLLHIANASAVDRDHSDSGNKSGPLAIVNGWAIPEKSFDIYYDYQLLHDDALEKGGLLHNIVMNRLLSQFALSSAGTELLNDDSDVAYNTETAVSDLLTAIIKTNFRDGIDLSIAASDKKSLQSFVTKPFDLSKTALKSIVVNPEESFILLYKLNQNQVKAAKQQVVLSYKFPESDERNVSLFDIYQSSNIQEKMRIHHLDLVKLQGLIQRYMTSKYTQYWLEHHSGLSSVEITAVKDFIMQNRLAGQFYRYSGFKAGIHDENTRLRDVTAEVTEDEVRAYYQSHQDSFKTIIKVKARHITLVSQSLADKVHAELKAGLKFSEAIAKYSSADDRNLPIPGNLGWINRDGNNSWLSSIPFTQKQGHFSPAFMSPISGDKKRVWEIVFVDERIEGFHSIDSETVRYQASREVAKQKIHEYVVSLRKDLVSSSDIRLSAEYKSLFRNASDTPVIDIFEQKHVHDHAEH